MKRKLKVTGISIFLDNSDKYFFVLTVIRIIDSNKLHGVFFSLSEISLLKEKLDNVQTALFYFNSLYHKLQIFFFWLWQNTVTTGPHVFRRCFIIILAVRIRILKNTFTFLEDRVLIPLLLHPFSASSSSALIQWKDTR